jgi:hypothetical protein
VRAEVIMVIEIAGCGFEEKHGEKVITGWNIEE